jgi:GTPase SAR1 family protein
MQDAKYIFRNKIIENINSIKNNQDGQEKKYDINYLTILLVGRKTVGKTTLIKYILNLKDEDIKRLQKNAGNSDFVTYKSKNITYLKLIEYRGIGYEKGSDPKTIGHNTVKFINNHITKSNKNKGDSYCDYVHCIWYCVSDARFEEDERIVLRQLRSSYQDNNLPIVLVYTQAIDREMADKMGNYIDEIGEKTDFVKVCAREVELANNGGRLPSFGKEELLNLTLRKCTEALGGNMINIMIKKISNDIKEIMLDINSHNEKALNNLIIDQFTNKYNEVLKDEQFMNYIINMIGRNLEKLFYGKKIFNSSLNLLIQSDIIRNIKSFISFIRQKQKNL